VALDISASMPAFDFQGFAVHRLRNDLRISASTGSVVLAGFCNVILNVSEGYG
jgi:hypothetical protein